MRLRPTYAVLMCCLALATLACPAAAGTTGCPYHKIVKGLQLAMRDGSPAQKPPSAPQTPPKPHRKLQQVTGTYPGGGPAGKDWSSVVSACQQLVTYEKRFCNFYIRAAFHDSLSTKASCTTGICSGADASLFLSNSELVRPENAYEDFSMLAGRSAIRISRWFNVSVADAMAVCASSCSVMINGPDVLSVTPIRVGRIDSATPGPAGQLPAATATTDEFAAFFTARGITLSEAAALMGSHALIDEQRCFRGTNGVTRNWCDPTVETCRDVRMFNFAGERYFRDLCTPKMVMVPDAELPPSQIDEMFNPFATEGEWVRSLEPEEYENLRRSELCSWTSPEQRRNAMALMAQLRAGAVGNVIPKAAITPVWVNKPSLCVGLSANISNNCPHTKFWFYTLNDGWLATACQGTLPATYSQTTGATLRTELTRYTVRESWARAYSLAFAKMIDMGANWAPGPVVTITGKECASGFRHPTVKTETCSLCSPTTGCPATGPSSGCICSTAFTDGTAMKAGTSVTSVIINQIATVPKLVPPTDAQTLTSAVNDLYNDPNFNKPGVDLPDPDAALIDLDVMLNAGTAAFNPLTSPYFSAQPTQCAAGGAYAVGGFPSSIIPFTRRFVNPPRAQSKGTSCRTDGHCAVVYDITAQNAALDIFGGTMPACNTLKTNVMAYNGIVPGPTIMAPVGHEVVMQLRNSIGAPFELGHSPCNAKNGRPNGRPISVHLHGSASLAPFDGWAEDETCSTEGKTYIYPNNRPTTGWYHDHGLHVTAENAYYGMAGFYTMSDYSVHGSCGAPYGMDGMEELYLMLGDRLVDSSCQLFMDPEKAHRNNIYGDINLVSGIPFPQMDLQPKWYRLRVLNSGIVRPFLIKLKDSLGNDVGASMCKVIGGDGGYRKTAVDFPKSGLLLGAAERYDVVCDFSGAAAGKTFYLWNGRNRKFMKDVPYFCFSHLLARITVASRLPAGTPPPPVFTPTLPPVEGTMTAFKVFTQTDYNQALTLAKAGTPHRRMKFGRRNGMWVVNGETWDTFKLAAKDIGVNTWELWLLETGGGWFHPIHIHLVDFFVLSRTSINAATPDMTADGVWSYEQMTPKDVVYLGPSQKIYVVARFGPHRGDYMFHCHNLVHEDNDMMRSMRMVATAGKTASTVLPIQTAAAGLTLYDSYSNPLFNGTNAAVSQFSIAADATLASSRLNMNAYAIFYPLSTQTALLDATANPWKVTYCPISGPAALHVTGVTVTSRLSGTTRICSASVNVSSTPSPTFTRVGGVTVYGAWTSTINPVPGWPATGTNVTGSAGAALGIASIAGPATLPSTAGHGCTFTVTGLMRAGSTLNILSTAVTSQGVTAAAATTTAGLTALARW